MKNRKQILDYWISPDDGRNGYEFYLGGWEKSLFLAELFLKYVPFDSSILELGCSVGRNLRVLDGFGYDDLGGVEVNRDAWLNRITTKPIFLSTIETYMGLPPSHDVIFTMATLEHIHPDSEWIFAKMQESAKMIITIEDERQMSERHFPRNYKRVFKDMNHIHSEGCGNVRGLNKNFIARVFINDKTKNDG